MTTPSLVLIDRPADGLAVVTLNRPEALNALSNELRRQFTAAFDTLMQDGTRVVVLAGAGRAFCAGLDLRELGARAQSGQAAFGMERELNIVGAMEAFAGPIIGAVQGAAVTGGFEVALACDLLFAAPDARFGDTHGRVGIMPGWGMSQRLSRRIGIARAKEMSLTGNYIDAATAERWGLVNRIVPNDALLAQAVQLGKDMLELSPTILPKYKRLIDEGFATTQAEGLALEQQYAREWNNANTQDVLPGGGMAALQARARKG
ncbi:hypothetical protein CCO03_16065 [Comamonas serinivorans]|uniref:Enoyl-CoA hydratase n=1 Tax=Comamonas serinivorans TaxID=1082851 RepID=A0A1Y0ERF7_9BURK|nr:enoyl-CoA hydratase [Comamonas serinivorans]ARU05981.1 hypothetical protein CCO03_16065 [Comamonas serinivorans]